MDGLSSFQRALVISACLSCVLAPPSFAWSQEESGSSNSEEDPQPVVGPIDGEGPIEEPSEGAADEGVLVDGPTDGTEAGGEDVGLDGVLIAQSEQPAQGSVDTETTLTGDADESEYDIHVEARKSRFEHAIERKDVVDGETLERNGITNLEDAVRLTTSGARSLSVGNARGISVDGLGAAQVVVLVDGVPTGTTINTADGPVVDLAAIQVGPEDIARIEVDRGLGAAGNTGRGSVSINVVTKRGSKRRVSASSTVRGSEDALVFQSHRVSGQEPLGGGVTARASAAVDFQEAVDVNKDGTFDLSERDTYGGEVQLAYAGSAADVALVFRGRSTTVNALGQPEKAGIVGEDDAYTRTSTQGYDADLNSSYKFSPELSIESRSSVRLGAHRFDKIGNERGDVRPKTQTDRIGLNQVLRLESWHGSHQVAPHLSLQAEEIVRRGDLGTFGPRWVQRGGGGIRHSFLLGGDKVEIFDGVEGDVSNIYGVGWGAEVGAAVYPLDWLTARTSATRSRRLPIAEELYFDFDHSEVGYRLYGNPDLQPEVAQTLRAGVVVGADRSPVRLELEGHYSELEDAIVPAPLPGASPSGTNAIEDFTYGNTNATLAGLNTGLRLSLPAHVTVDGSHSWLPLADDDSGVRLRLRAEHTVRVQTSIAYLKRRMSSSVQVEWRSELPVPADSVAAPGPTLLRIGTQAKLGAGFRAGIALENALNQTNATWGPQTGRTGMVRLAYVAE